MPRRKVTFVYDPERRERTDGPTLEQFIGKFEEVDPLSVTVEDLPDPPVVQKFIVERVATPEQGRKTARHIYARLASYPDDGFVTVTEVTDG